MLRIVNTPSRASTGAVDAFLGARLKARRTELGHTQEQVAATMQALGSVTWRPATVAAVETGRRNLTITELGMLCGIFGVDLVEFVGDVPDEGELAPLAWLGSSAGGHVTMTPADEDRRKEIARAARLLRLEDAVFKRAVPAFRDAVGDQREWLRGELRRNVRQHYGHDLLEERDLRLDGSEDSKTWVSRRLADEVALLDWVAKFNVWAAEGTEQ